MRQLNPVPIEEESAIDDWGEAPAIEIDAEEIYGSEKSMEDLAGIEQSQLSDRLRY